MNLQELNSPLPKPWLNINAETMNCTTLTATNIINPTFNDAILSVGGAVVSGNLPKYADTTGLLAEDSGINANNVLLNTSSRVIPYYATILDGNVITNTVTPTSLLTGSSSVGSLIFPANSLIAGNTIKFYQALFMGAMSISTTLTLSIYCNGSSIFSTGSITTNSSTTYINAPIIISTEFVILDTSNIQVSSIFLAPLAGQSVSLQSTSKSLNATIINTFDFVATWSDSSTSNQIQSNTIRIDYYKF